VRPLANFKEAIMSGSSATLEYSPWYRSLNRTQWKTLIASNLGWTFDGFEVFALILTIGAALHQLLDSSEYKYIPFYAGAVIAITVFGWGAGGLLGGILADYIGRKRSMTLTILAYSLLTGLSALSWLLLYFAFSLGSRSARNGRRGPRSRLSFGRTRRAARVAHFCNADTRSEAFLPQPSGLPLGRPVPAPGATCI
jgi:hypothetical protein